MITFTVLLSNRFVSTTKISMTCVVNWIPLRIHVRSRNTQPHLQVKRGSHFSGGSVNSTVVRRPAPEINTMHYVTINQTDPIYMVCRRLSSTLVHKTPPRPGLFLSARLEWIPGIGIFSSGRRVFSFPLIICTRHVQVPDFVSFWSVPLNFPVPKRYAHLSNVRAPESWNWQNWKLKERLP